MYIFYFVTYPYMKMQCSLVFNLLVVYVMILNLIKLH